MITFRPHFFGETIYESLDYIKEFETVEEMKEQLYKYYKNKGYDITLNDIKIDNRLTTKDERLEWEDTKMVCLNINGTSKCIGYCATKYQNLEKTIRCVLDYA